MQAQQNLERINSIFNNLQDKTFMIPHGHFLKYANLIDKDKARDVLGISKDKFVLLFFGQIKKVKGVDLLLKAMANIYKKEMIYIWLLQEVYGRMIGKDMSNL